MANEHSTTCERISLVKFPNKSFSTATCDYTNNRVTHGECIPVSSAIRLRGIRPKASFSAFGVVATFCSKSTFPASSRTQYQLDRSPRSSPIVYLCR